MDDKTKRALGGAASATFAVLSLVVAVSASYSVIFSPKKIGPSAEEIIADLNSMSARNERMLAEQKAGDEEYRRMRDSFNESIHGFKKLVNDLSENIKSGPSEGVILSQVSVVKSDLISLQQKTDLLLSQIVSKPEDAISMIVIKDKIENLGKIMDMEKRNGNDILEAKLSLLKNDIERLYQIVVGLIGAFAISVFGLFATPFINRAFLAAKDR